MKAPLARVTTDVTGLIVTASWARSPFQSSWTGLQIVVGGIQSFIASVQSQTQLTLTRSVGQFSTPVPLLPNRETIYQAFFNLVKQAPSLTTSSRVPRDFRDYQAEELPTLYIEQFGEIQHDAARVVDGVAEAVRFRGIKNGRFDSTH